MILLIEEKINEIPVLEVVQLELKEEKLPAVFYYHGFYGEKISSLTLAYKIAAKGYRVIMPDAYYHGDRKQDVKENVLNLAFWDIVEHNIKEFETLTSHYVSEQLIDENRIGVGGTSMGGITSYGLLATYPNIKVATILMGTAYMQDYAQKLIDVYNKNNTEKIPEQRLEEVMQQVAGYDLSRAMTRLNERPLLIWHGEKDEVVPFAYSPKFYEQAKSLYSNQTHLKFVREKDRSHHISRLSMREAAKWFEKYL